MEEQRSTQVQDSVPCTGPSATPEFRTLFESQFPYVMRVLRDLGVQPRDLEDCAHELFLAVHRNLRQYEPGRPLRPWIFKFAVGTAANYRRLARHRREVYGSDGEETSEAPGWADQSDARAVVAAALEQMDIDRCAVLVMHELEGHTMPEVAEALGIPLGTAYSRLRFAREDFKRVLARRKPQGREQ